MEELFAVPVVTFSYKDEEKCFTLQKDGKVNLEKVAEFWGLQLNRLEVAIGDKKIPLDNDNGLSVFTGWKGNEVYVLVEQGRFNQFLF